LGIGNEEVSIPQTPDDAVRMGEENRADVEELDEQKRNLIRAQKRLLDGCK
jgi:hypothetical protein